MAMM
ncbi:hypothetical protein A2U01_0068491, partial [Trifolium medium]|jgi:serine/threonine protein kinase